MADDEQNSEGLLKSFYRYLLDAVISRNEMEEIENTRKTLSASLIQDQASVDDLKQHIYTELNEFSAKDLISSFDEPSNELKTLVQLTLEKFKVKTQEDYKTKNGDLDVSYSSAKTNALKNIQAILSSSFLKIIDSNIITKWTDGIYDSSVKYKAEGGIEYEFSLNSRSVDILKELLRFSSLEKNVKLPIESAINWAGKDAQVDLEKIDKYTLESANLNKGNLFAVFADPDSEAKFTFVMSRGGDSSFLSIDYTNEEKSIEITANSALNNVVDMEKIQRPLDLIYGTLKELETNKTKLVSVSMGGKDILSSAAYRTLALKIVEVRAADLKNVLQTIPATAEGDQISLESLNEKLKFCANTGDAIKHMLELGS